SRPAWRASQTTARRALDYLFTHPGLFHVATAAWNDPHAGFDASNTPAMQTPENTRGLGYRSGLWIAIYYKAGKLFTILSVGYAEYMRLVDAETRGEDADFV